MKIIHTGDIHLNSALVGVKDGNARRLELLQALGNLAEYANNSDVGAVIVAGDLFDDQFTTQNTVQSVAHIVNQSKAQWYVLQGNHGQSAPYVQLASLCANLHLFGNEWKTYLLGDVAITGRELGENDQQMWQQFALDGSKYNVVTLHGDVTSDAYGVVDSKVLSQSGAKYVALGHRHAYNLFKMGNVPACYCGTLEPRGFDEAFDTGFVVLDTATNKVQFVPQWLRRVCSVTVDVTGVTSDVALQSLVQDKIASVSPRNYLNLLFVGQTTCKLNVLTVANQVAQDRFFALRVKDETTMQVDIDQLSKEVSLRGQFVNLALQIEDEKLRSDALKLGLAVLGGEDLQ